MKVYQVVRHGKMWHVLMPDASHSIEESEDRSRIIAWAREHAKKNDGAVHIRDIGGQIEMTYAYVDGVERQYDRTQWRQVSSALKR